MHNINCVRGGGFTHVLLYQNCIKKCEEGGGGGGVHSDCYIKTVLKNVDAASLC